MNFSKSIIADLDQVLTPIATIDVKHGTKLGCEIAVTGQAFDQFEIHGRFHPQGAYQKLFSTAGEYISVLGLLTGTSGDLTTIAAGSSGWFTMDVDQLESIVIKAACAADNGSAVVFAGMN